ncbi:cysteine hydrolase family protein [Aeromicrobium wangtongii]|uniref:cysteine hydrolase family protein n=1 Tax=Aeromicrobium wangtongii TaxID=2969247 RepID=UPI0020179AB1|nr:isochorismatase family cysteine hydrolase [Aeromicrobium wangtongii]MCL3819627.1 cysteine hydrolase [Aeromicrobium wangtongii]
MTLTRDASALLVIDMQNGFLDAKGSMAAIGMPADQLQPSIAGTQRLIESARAAGVPVIFTRYQYMPGYADGGILPNELVPAMREADALVTGTWDAEVADVVAPREGEVIIDKARPSSFYGTQLEPVLTSLGVRNLVLCGVTTNICVETTARDAGQRDYRVHVISDACAEYEQARHEHALNTIGFTFGWVNTVDEVVQAWHP